MRNIRIVLIVAMLGLGLVSCQLPDPDDYLPQEKVVKPPPIQPPPLVLGFAVVQVQPNSGMLRGMESVELHGGGFQQGARVFFGATEGLNVLVTSPKRIWVTTPPHPVGTVTVRVVNPDGGETALSNGFTYRAEKQIVSVFPAQGPSVGGIPIEIHGSGMRQVDTVLVGGRMALDVVSLDDSTVLAVLPEGVAGRSDVHVIGADGVGRAEKAFLYLDRLYVAGIAPQAGPANGGGIVSLTGDGLVAESFVFFEDVLADIVMTSTDGRHLAVRVPPGVAGSVDVTIVSPLDTLSLPAAYSYLDEEMLDGLNIHGVWPTSGPATGGGEAVLSVTGLAPDDAEIAVRFGSAGAAIIAVNAGQNRVSVVTPPGAAGQTVSVTVSVSGGESIAWNGAYTYESEMAITDVQPTTGPVSGGTSVRISGVGFEADAEVWVGALPVLDVEVLSATELKVTTAAGSPGEASVRVRSGGRIVARTQGFKYGDVPSRLLVSSPQSGAIAGNTLVHLFGVELPTTGTVWFGETAVDFIERISSTHAIVRTPRAETIGNVDVRLEVDGDNLLLPHEFTFYDPRSQWGGTWGEPVDDSLNVTVREAVSGDPIESALVVIGHDVPPRLMGYTDDRGQVTLSDLGLRGTLDVTAAREGFSASSVMDFDATNVTLSLESMQPPSPGNGGGTILPPGAVTGLVHGIGKYLVLPPGSCDELSEIAPGFCTPCETDTDCSEMAPQCTTLPDKPAFCSLDCAVDSDCPQHFLCGGADEGNARCVPTRGERQVRCFVSNSSLFASPTLQDTAIIKVEAGEQAYSMSNVRLGEVAVYCLGGLAKTVAGTPMFEPYVMGIDRHVFIPPGPELESGDPIIPVRADISLDIPLDGTIRMTVEPRPYDVQSGPNSAEATVLIDLGSDGYIPLSTQTLQPSDRDIVMEDLPNALTGQLYDAEYVYYAGALTQMDDYFPTSEVLREGRNRASDGPFFRSREGAWSEESSGYDGDVTSVFTMTNGTALATTSTGGVMMYDGSSWWPQPVAGGDVFRDVASDGQNGVVFVGDAGRVLHYDGVAWDVGTSPTDRNLHAVVNAGENHAVAVGEYVLMSWVAGEWTVIEWGPPKDLRGICRGQNMALWAVGRHGAVVHRPGAEQNWQSVNVPVHDHLNAVWCDHNGVIIAVGEGGRALQGNQSAGMFHAVDLPTHLTLHDVWGRSPDDVYAVGDGATIMHFDGSQWSVVTQGLLDLSLRAVHGQTDPSDTVLAMGSYAVHMGPFVWVPQFATPRFGHSWSPQRIEWAVEQGAQPTLHEMRIYGATGSLAWGITAPGHLTDMQLPDLWAIDQLMIPLPGGKRMYSYLVEHPDFDINAFDIRAFRLLDWNAWSMSTLTFDNP